MSSYVSIKALRPMIKGRWLMILRGLAPELNQAINRLGYHCPCPIHGGKDGFRFFKDSAQTGGAVCNTCGVFRDGFELLERLKNWQFSESLSQINDYLGGVERSETLPRLSFVNQIESHSLNSEPDFLRERYYDKNINTVWEQTLSLSDKNASIGRLYFARRGINILDYDVFDDALRFHPSLAYYHDGGRVSCHFPGLIAKVVKKRECVTLQRIYLDPLGIKAPVPIVKKMMPFPKDRSLSGSAVCLGELKDKEHVIHIAEGIETALAVHVATSNTVWSGLNTALLARFEPPESIRRVVIWADADRNRAGEIAAHKLAQSLNTQGIESIIKIPPMSLRYCTKGVDWNDVLNAYGKLGFGLTF